MIAQFGERGPFRVVGHRSESCSSHGHDLFPNRLAVARGHREVTARGRIFGYWITINTINNMYMGGVKMKIGDRVRVKNAPSGTPKSAIGKVFTIKEDGGHPEFGLDVPGATGTHNLWWYAADDLELVTKAACILTEKVMVGDTPCRKILGFEGILGRDELPAKYTDGKPSFWRYDGLLGTHVFDGDKMDWGVNWERGDVVYLELPAGVNIDVGYYNFAGMHVGDLWPETTFQELLTWLKRAGSRLAKIRKREKAAWSGKETIEI